MTYDVVTFGESMLRMSPPSDLRIEQASSFEIHVAGSESNTAVGLARLGAKVNWFSRLPNSSLGKLIANRIREHGVDVSNIIWTDDERLGLYFVEQSQAPRSSQVIYDRAYSAMSAIQASDLAAELFQKDKARLLHTSGITLALSASAADCTIQAISMAKNAGWIVSFDVNYRSKLWSAEVARLGCEPCLEKGDIIFIPLRDARLLFDYSDRQQASEILADLHNQYPQAIIVITQGDAGSICCSAQGEVYTQKAFPVSGVHRIGAGDAFTAGFLYSYLYHKQDLQMALSWGNALAALKFTINGDMPLIDREHAEALVQHQVHSQLLR